MLLPARECASTRARLMTRPRSRRVSCPHGTRESHSALKQQLGAELARLVTGWNADDIAALLRTDRARISELRRVKLDRFSLETLIRYLARLRHAWTSPSRASASRAADR